MPYCFGCVRNSPFLVFLEIFRGASDLRSCVDQNIVLMLRIMLPFECLAWIGINCRQLWNWQEPGCVADFLAESCS